MLVDHKREVLTMTDRPAPMPPTPFFACVSKTLTSSRRRVLPGTPPEVQLDGEEGLLLSCSPWEVKTLALECKKGPQHKRPVPPPSRGTRPLLAPLLIPRTVRATSATEGTCSGSCSRLPFKAAAQDCLFRDMILPPPPSSSSSKFAVHSEKPGQALHPWLLA